MLTMLWTLGLIPSRNKRREVEGRGGKGTKEEKKEEKEGRKGK
jgi:hypothetical protein